VRDWLIYNEKNGGFLCFKHDEKKTFHELAVKVDDLFDQGVTYEVAHRVLREIVGVLSVKKGGSNYASKNSKAW
jgi:hypothetical protein